MRLFHPSKLVAGAVGGAGWRPWGLSNLIMAIFSDTHSLTSGLSFCEFPGGVGGWVGIGGLERAGSLEKRPQGLSSALRWGRGILMSNQGSSFHLHKDRDSSCPGHLHFGA